MLVYGIRLANMAWSVLVHIEGWQRARTNQNKHNMRLFSAKLERKRGHAGFTLAELMVSFLIFAMVVGGVVYGYTQANRMSDYTAMSMAAASQAMQGIERARAASWNPTAYPTTYGPGGSDELGSTNVGAGYVGGLPIGPVLTSIDFMDIPSKGAPDQTNFTSWVTNNIYVTNISVNPPLRQIRSDVIWTYPASGQLITNSVMDLRAPDQ